MNEEKQILLAFKGNNSCKMYNFKIKIGNVQMMNCPVDITTYYFLNGIIVLFVCLMMFDATFKNI